MALWEDLFLPLALPPTQPTPAKDLMALGYVGFWLLAGRTVDRHGKPLNPRDPSLNRFVRRLVGIDAPFESAAVARRALRSLPIEPSPASDDSETESQDVEERSLVSAQPTR